MRKQLLLLTALLMIGLGATAQKKKVADFRQQAVSSVCCRFLQSGEPLRYLS